MLVRSGDYRIGFIKKMDLEEKMSTLLQGDFKSWKYEIKVSDEASKKLMEEAIEEMPYFVFPERIRGFAKKHPQATTFALAVTPFAVGGGTLTLLWYTLDLITEDPVIKAIATVLGLFLPELVALDPLNKVMDNSYAQRLLKKIEITSRVDER